MNKSKNTQVILIPLSEISEKMITMIHSPIVIALAFYYLAYAMNKIIEACSALYQGIRLFEQDYFILHQRDYSGNMDIFSRIYTRIIISKNWYYGRRMCI